MTHITKNKSFRGPTTFRNSVFWFFDWLKGSKIRNHHNAVRRINKNHEAEYAVRMRKEYLSKILQHTVRTVPYYKELGVTKVSLDGFPVIDKNLIRKQSEAFCSTEYIDSKTFKITTSGSTGTPFTVIHDGDKRRRHKADVRFFWDTICHPWGTKLYYLKIWNEQNRKGRFTQTIQNIVPIDVFKLNDIRIAKLLTAIKTDNAPKSILGYASALDQIVKYLKRNPTDLTNMGVISIIAMSEALDSTTKDYLEYQFDCPVVSRYANLENGMLAQQTSFSGSDFLVNVASYHIEILALHKDIPVKEGETGRIVVTDLFNRAMPLIRYDTGDLGVLQKTEKNGRVQYVLKKVEGRKTDAVYDTNGEHISSLLLSNSMWKYVELNQFQFIQKAKDRYEFLLNPKGKFSREDELRKEFISYLGSDATIEVSYVDEIPLLSSGKRKKVLNTTIAKRITKKQNRYAF